MKALKSSVSKTGVTVLYQPDGREATVDIVFVHGLQGNPLATWECKQRGQVDDQLSPEATAQTKRHPFRLPFKRSRSKSPAIDNTRSHAGSQQDGGAKYESSICWPLDLLPDDCPNARIMTFGYDTQVSRGYATVDKSSIFAHGRDLLYELAREREKRGRPLIFVGHSLGGILVKEALRESEDSDKEHQKDIIQSTASVIFLATPHRGSNVAELGEIVRNIASIALRFDTNPEILHALAVDSPQLDVCRRSFIRQWNKYKFQVKTFQESQALTGVNFGHFNNLIVPDASSSFDDPREDAEKIYGNHMNMCKFTSALDPGYRKVGAELKRLVWEIERNHEQEASQNEQ